MRSAYDAPATPIDWTAWQTRFLFFTGKGGVGKTTIASTVAMHLAAHGERVLVVSTDPASNLDDVFEMAAGQTPTVVPTVPHLWIMNLDPEAAAAAYRERVVGPYRALLPAAAVRSMEEQLSGACTVEIAAFNEFTTLLADTTLVEQFDRIVFDTAPTGHTLRLLSLPRAWSGYIETSTHGASCLGPLAGLDAQRTQYAATVAALADAAQTTVILVSRPDTSALREAARAGGELATLGIANQHLVLNGMLLADPAGDPIAATLLARQQRALATMPLPLCDVPTSMVPLVAMELTGVAALRALAVAPLLDASTTDAMVGTDTLPAIPDLDALLHTLIADGRSVIMTMGKGGVGKTTLAATLALALARRGERVHLSTTDPAAHVADAVGADIPAGLDVSRIDPVAETQRYRDEIIAAAGALDEHSRAVLEEDLRSPCTEEIAVFRAFARTVAAADDGFVVLDTAPTGHTLLLLDAAEHYHREVARTTGQVPAAVRALLPRLRDPHRTKVLIVTLAESTPVHEAQRLQADLQRAGITPFGWIINASLAASGTAHALLAHRAQHELLHVRHVVEHADDHVWLVPWQADTAAPEDRARAYPEVVGVSA